MLQFGQEYRLLGEMMNGTLWAGRFGVSSRQKKKMVETGASRLTIPRVPHCQRGNHFLKPHTQRAGWSGWRFRHGLLSKKV